MTVEHAVRAIRVLVADDHPLIVEGVVSALQRIGGMDVVGQALAVGDVLPKWELLKPDVLVLDVRFGEVKTGLDVARELVDRHPEAKDRIVFYSQFDQVELVQEAYRVGSGFVTKNQTVEVLAQAIRSVHENEPYFLPEIAQRLALVGVRGNESPIAKLDERQRTVFKLLAQGLTGREIATELGLAEKTISNATQAIKDKLGVERPADITRLAVKYKVIEL